MAASASEMEPICTNAEASILPPGGAINRAETTVPKDPKSSRISASPQNEGRPLM